MFLSSRFPVIKPFVWWTLFLFLVVPLGGSILALIVVMPGVYAAREINGMAKDYQASPLEELFTSIWSGAAGGLLSLTIGGFIALMWLGILADVKMWFVALCYIAILVPWLLLGAVGRKVIRCIAPLSEAYQTARLQREFQHLTPCPSDVSAPPDNVPSSDDCEG
jgi:hypothetical protein